MTITSEQALAQVPILEFVRELLLAKDPPARTFQEMLHQLADLFAAQAAGVWLTECDQKVRPLSQFGYKSHPLNTYLTSLMPRLASEAVVAWGSEGDAWLLSRPATISGPGWVLGLGRSDTVPWDRDADCLLALVVQALQGLGARNPLSVWGRLARREQRQHHWRIAAQTAGKLAHDVGNVLTGVLGFADLARKQEGVSPLLTDFLQEIWEAGRKGARWVHHLQQFSRRGPGAAPCTSQLDQAFHHVLSPAAWPAGMAVILDLPPTLPAAGIAPDCLHDALAAVLENSAQAMKGQGNLLVQARSRNLTEEEILEIHGQAPAGPCLEIVLRDSGPGLSSEARQKLFSEPFFSSKPLHRGLGLAVVYGILQAHGGGFLLESPPQQGVTVRMFLPCAPPGPLAGASCPGGSSAFILVVDDDPCILELIRHTLEKAGHRVDAVDHPQTALALFKNPAADYQLVVTDLLMPDMTGFELAQQILACRPEIPLIFVSSQLSLQGVGAEELLRRFPLIRKPFVPADLADAVQTRLAATSV